MLDRSRSFSVRDEEIYRILKDKRVVIVANKADLPPELDIGEAGKRFAVKEIVEVSALKKEGLEKIEDAIAEKLFKGNVGVPEGPVVTNIRHRKILEKAALSMERPMKVMDNNYNGELMASDLNEAVYQLGLIIGESVGDDVLDRIFSGFCVGK
jgi:tRNA modification GTPase